MQFRNPSASAVEQRAGISLARLPSQSDRRCLAKELTSEANFCATIAAARRIELAA